MVVLKLIELSWFYSGSCLSAGMYQSVGVTDLMLVIVYQDGNICCDVRNVGLG